MSLNCFCTLYRYLAGAGVVELFQGVSPWLASAGAAGGRKGGGDNWIVPLGSRIYSPVVTWTGGHQVCTDSPD